MRAALRSLYSLEATRAEKVEMVRALPADGLVVLNGDDPSAAGRTTSEANLAWVERSTRMFERLAAGT